MFWRECQCLMITNKVAQQSKIHIIYFLEVLKATNVYSSARQAQIGSDGSVRCPIHGKKLATVSQTSISHGVYVWCDKCKDAILVDYEARGPD